MDGPRLHERRGESDTGSEADALAAGLVGPLQALGRGAVHVRASSFWRDASVRFEHGRDDWESYPTWLDAGALRREVLDAAVERGTYVPSLRDPASNRSTREPARPLPPRPVIIVSGEFLLDHGLPFEAVIHLDMSAAQRARLVDDHLRWTLPAYERYADSVGPVGKADVVVRARRYPTVRGLP